MSLDYSRVELVNNASLVSAINDELEKIETALADGLSRSGEAPNALGAALDAGGYDLLNVGTVSVDVLLIDGEQVPSLEDLAEDYATYLASFEAIETAAEAARDAAITAQGLAEAAQTQAEAAQAGAELAETNASISATNAATSESNAATSESNAASSESAAATSASNAATSESNASSSETNAAQSATDAQTAETNAETAETNAAASASAAATDADDAETARIAAEAAAAGVSLPPVTAGTEGQFLRVNSAEDGYELDEFYEYLEISLVGSGDFISGSLKVSRVGQSVTVISDGVVAHTGASSVGSAAGIIPVNLRPTDSVTNNNSAGAAGSYQLTSVLSDGTVGVTYDSTRAAPVTPLNISYVV